MTPFLERGHWPLNISPCPTQKFQSRTEATGTEMELLQGRNQGELRTVHLDLDDQSTSYTVRQRTPAQKNEGESTSPRRGIRSYLRSAIDGKEISAQSIYDDLIRKSDVLPPYINLLQAASTYNRVRSSDFDFISVSLTTAFSSSEMSAESAAVPHFKSIDGPPRIFPATMESHLVVLNLLGPRGTSLPSSPSRGSSATVLHRLDTPSVPSPISLRSCKF